MNLYAKLALGAVALGTLAVGYIKRPQGPDGIAIGTYRRDDNEDGGQGPTPPPSTPTAGDGEVTPAEESPKEEEVPQAQECEKKAVRDEELLAHLDWHIQREPFRKVDDARRSITILKGVTWTLTTKAKTTRRDIAVLGDELGKAFGIPKVVIKEWKRKCRSLATGETLKVHYATWAYCAHAKVAEITPEIVYTDDVGPFVDRSHATIHSVRTDSQESQPSPQPVTTGDVHALESGTQSSPVSPSGEDQQKSPRSGGDNTSRPTRPKVGPAGGHSKGGVQSPVSKSQKRKKKRRAIQTVGLDELHLLNVRYNGESLFY
jgi:hypothetical protein